VRSFIFRPAVGRYIFLCALIAIAMTPRLARADNDDLKKQIENMKNGIAPFPKKFATDPALRAALDDLAKAIQDVDCNVFSDVIGCNATRVGGAIDGLNNSVTGQVPKADPKDLILKAINALIDISENDPTVNKPDATTGKVDPAKNKPDPNGAATLAAKLLQGRLKVAGVDPTKKNLADALKGLMPAPADTKVISVYRAYYGDLAGISTYLSRLSPSKNPPHPKLATPPDPSASFKLDEDLEDYRDDTRVCSATRSLQAYCQGKSTCWNVGDNSPVRQGTYLCGYEPAPYANPINKGLVVVYNCVSKKDFDHSISSPKLDDEEKHVVHFRLGETAQIICSEEPPKPAATDKTGAAQ
jgi:hypothetical protein